MTPIHGSQILLTSSPPRIAKSLLLNCASFLMFGCDPFLIPPRVSHTLILFLVYQVHILYEKVMDFI